MSQALLRRIGIVLAALAGAWVLLALVRRVREDRNVALDLPRVDTAAVDTVVLARRGDSIVLARVGTAWRVNGFPASRDAMSSLFQGLTDSSLTTELVAENAASHERLGVTGDSSRRVRIMSRGRAVLDLTTGKRTSDFAGGLLVRLQDDDAVYSLRGSLANALERSADDWRDKRIITADPDSIGTIEVKRGRNSFTIKRRATGWQFATGAAADSAAASGLATAFREVNAAGFATTAQADSANFTRNYGRARLLSRSGRPIAHVVFDSAGGSFWARADTGGVVYRVESWVWNQIAPAESTLRMRKN